MFSVTLSVTGSFRPPVPPFSWRILPYGVRTFLPALPKQPRADAPSLSEVLLKATQATVASGKQRKANTHPSSP